MRLQYAILILVGLAAAGCDAGRPATQPLVPDPPTPAGPAGSVDSPQYANWAGFPVGATVVHRSVTRAEDQPGETVTTTTHTLVEVAADHVVVEMGTVTRRFDGLETKNPPDRYTHPRLVPRVADGRPAESGEAIVTAAGKQFRAKWRKGTDRNEAGQVFTQVWSSPEVPGGLVKAVMRTPDVGKTTTTELMEVQIPAG
jgi:hypothetical protein